MSSSPRNRSARRARRPSRSASGAFVPPRTGRRATPSSRTSCSTGSRPRATSRLSPGATPSGSARSPPRSCCLLDRLGTAAPLPLHPLGRARLRLGQGHRVRHHVRLLDPRRAPDLGSPDGRRRLPPPGPRVPDRRLQERRRQGPEAGVELGARRRDAARDALPLVHGVPASLGPARLLGGDGRHQHRLLGPRGRSDDPRAPDRRAHDRAADAHPLLRPPRPLPAGRTRGSLRSTTCGASARTAASRAPTAPPTLENPAEVTPSKTKTYTLLGIARGTSPVIRASTLEAPDTTVNSVPDLTRRAAIVILGTIAVVGILSVFLRSPLEEPANPLITPNPAKAPWYFLWLQEIVTDTTFHIGSLHHQRRVPRRRAACRARSSRC